MIIMEITCISSLRPSMLYPRTTPMMIPWYLTVKVFIDGLMDKFVRAGDFHRHVVVFLEPQG